MQAFCLIYSLWACFCRRLGLVIVEGFLCMLSDACQCCRSGSRASRLSVVTSGGSIPCSCAHATQHYYYYSPYVTICGWKCVNLYNHANTSWRHLIGQHFHSRGCLLQISVRTNMAACLENFCFITKLFNRNESLKTFEAQLLNLSVTLRGEGGPKCRKQQAGREMAGTEEHGREAGH